MQQLNPPTITTSLSCGAHILPPTQPVPIEKALVYKYAFQLNLKVTESYLEIQRERSTSES